jgi:hypothetical protein
MGCGRFPGIRSRGVAGVTLAGLAAGLAWLLLAVPAFGDVETNLVSAQPVCVDGIFSLSEAPTNELEFVIGSVFDGENDPLQNSRSAYAIAQDEEDPKLPYGLYGAFEFGLRTQGFNPGQVIGKFTFPTTVNGVSRPNFTLWLIGVATTDPDAPKGCKAFVDLDGNGTFEGLAGTLGIKAAISFGVGALPPPAHLRGELFIPLNAPKRFFTFLRPGQDGVFPVPGPTLLNGYFATDQSATPVLQSSATILFTAQGSTTGNSDFLPIRAVIDVKPGPSNAIGSSDLGALPVAIFTTLPRLNALNVVVSSLRLRDPNLTAPGAKATQGSVIVKDVNGDGQQDLVVHFNFKDAPGSLNSNTTVLQLTGNLANGRPIQGSDSVRIVR